MRSLALVVLLVGCGGAAARPTPPPASVAAPAAAAVPPRDPCAGRAAPPIDIGDTCLAVGADAWVVVLENVTEEDCGDDGPATLGTYRIALERADGSRAVTDPAEFRYEGGDHFSVSFQGAFDYDGDGAAELAMHFERTYDEGGDAWTDLLTAPPGSAEVHGLPAADAFAATIDEMIDADGDGRPDIAAHAPWRTGDWGYSEGGGGFTGGPRTLFHSLADGTFVTGDAVGRAFWSAECPAVDRLVPPMTDPDDEDTYANGDVALTRVTCAALTGEASAVSMRLEHEWSAHPCTYEATTCDELVQRLRARIAAVAAR